MNLSVHPAPAAPAAGAYAWPNRHPGQALTAVLRISGMPRSLRPAIERAMARCITSESEFIVPGDDPLTAQWCTRWYRDAMNPECLEPGAGIGCRQVITGTAEELHAFGRAVALLAKEYGFSGTVEPA